LGDIPLFVLSGTEHGLPPELEEKSQDFQNELAALSTNSIHHFVEGADHAAFWRDPEKAKVSVAAILQVVNAADTGTTLK